MPSQSGQIEVLSIKPLQQPDNYGNTFRCSIKVGEDWYSYGSLKKDTLSVKKGDSWVQVAKGMDIEFMYDVSGDFKNIRKKSFEVVGDAPPPQQQQAPQKAPVAKTGYVNINPAEVGQCLNLAESCIGLTKDELLDKEKVTQAIAWYKAVRELFTELYPDTKAQTPAGDPAPFVEDEFDEDDI